MKSWKKIGILLGVITVLGGLARWDEWKTKKDSDTDAQKNHLLALEPNVVSEFSMTSRASSGAPRETVRIRKSGESWAIIEPVNAPADQKTVDNFLKSLSDYKYERAVDSASRKLSEFGLDDAGRKITLTLGGKDAGVKSIYVGINTPVGYSVYSRVEGDDRIFVGSQYLETAAAKGLNDFREKLFVKIDESKLKSLTYKRKGFADIKMSKTESGFDVASDTASFKGDDAEISSFIHALNEAAATKFSDAPIASQVAGALRPGQRFYEVSWETEGSAPQTLVFGKVEKRLWAALDSPTVAYELPDTFEEKIRRQTDDFRNRRIFSIDSAALERVEFDGSTFESVAGTWYATADVEAAKVKKEGAEEPKAADQIRSLVVELEFAKTIEFLGAKEPGLLGIISEAPKHKVILAFGNGKSPPVTVEAWKKPNSENFILRHSGSAELYVVPKEIFEPKAAAENFPDVPPAQDTSAADPMTDKDAG
jgi:hypothetical protein